MYASENSVCARQYLVLAMLVAFLMICTFVFAASETAAASVDASFKSSWLCQKEIPSSAAGTRLVDPDYGNLTSSAPLIVRVKSAEAAVCRGGASVAESLGYNKSVASGDADSEFEYEGDGKYFLWFEVRPAGTTDAEVNENAIRAIAAAQPESLMQPVPAIGKIAYVDRCAGPCVEAGNAGLFSGVASQISNVGQGGDANAEVVCPTIGFDEANAGGGNSEESAVGASFVNTATTYPPQLLVECYCQQELTSQVQKLGPIAGSAAVLSDSDSGDVCSTLVTGYISASGLVILAGFITTVVNSIMRAVLHCVTNLELHISWSDLKASLMQKLFIS